MKTLLPLDSPKYLRRLVREVNSLLRAGKSVYCEDSLTPNIKHKVFKVSYNGGGNALSVECQRGYVFSIKLWDGDSREIVASRE